MQTCPSCKSKVPESNRTCSTCGISMPASADDATMIMVAAANTPATPPPAPSASLASSTSLGRTRLPSTIKPARFPPGTMLAGRYQIIGMLGQGGMGEVYRANDLTLDQPVALKFLPASMAANPAMLGRFHGEVRIARQVSHPNVCRVYDIGEVDDQLFISMEYVDGEDLGMLLRRIGRLPTERAVEFARKICAGLAAAHEKGVVHRDLKPANIMIDSDGQVVIMDFGLAAVAEQIGGAEIMAGTPAYMAPEQLSGREVTVKSDIYALGLVLYEMFTGKRPFEGNTLADMIRVQQSTIPPSITEVVKDLDPAVERVILRCIAPDPRNRPGSALAVAAALPGGDPLAAALAAGETPSPDLVAASGETSSVRPWIAFSLLATIIVSMIAIVIILPMTGYVATSPLELPPEVLAQKARDYAASFGYTDKPMSWANNFEYDDDALKYIDHNIPAAERWPRLQAGHPPVITYWYRQSQRYLEPEKSRVTPTDPSMDSTGMIFERLDPRGRLLTFHAVPNQVEDPAPPGMAVDWNILLKAAGIDPAQAADTPPQWTPPVYADARKAWNAPMPGAPQTQLRIEAASLRGKPVFFSVVGPWTRPARMEPFVRSVGVRVAQLGIFAVAIGLLITAILLTRHNLKRGRGDTKGASRLAFFFLIVYMAIFTINVTHLPTQWELNTGFRALAYAMMWAAAIWAGYVAVEPFVRRHWPQAIVSWTRLLSGGYNDPLVGRDVLIGIAVGCFFVLVNGVSSLIEKPLGALPSTQAQLFTLLGARHTASVALIASTNTLLQVLVAFMLLFLLRTLLRREWLAAIGFIVLFTLTGSGGSPAPLIDVPFALALAVVNYLILTRVGFLAMLVALYVNLLILFLPITSDFSSWYAGATVFALVSTGALTAYAAAAALRGSSLIKDELL